MTWVDTAQGVGAALGAAAFFWEAGRLTWMEARRPRAEIEVVAHEARIPESKIVAAQLAVTTKGRPATSIKIAAESWVPKRADWAPSRTLQRLTIRQPTAISQKHLVASLSTRRDAWREYEAVDFFTVDSTMELFVPYFQFAETLLVDVGIGRREEIFDPHQHEINVYMDVFLAPEGGKRSQHRFHLFAEMHDQPLESDQEGNTITWAPGSLECRLLERGTKDYDMAERHHPRHRGAVEPPRPRGPRNW